MQRRVLCRGVALGCSAAMIGSASGQWVTFDDETGSRLTLTSVPSNDGEEKDIIAADVDHDGDLDVIVVRKSPFSNPGARDDVLLMNEGGVLVDRTAMFGFDAGASDARDVQCVDLTGDGWEDIIICTTFNDPIRLYVNQGEIGGVWQGFADETAARLGAVVEGSRLYCAVGVEDVTGNGAADLFFSNYNGGDDLLYINDGSGNFTDQTAARMGSFANSAFGTSNVIVDIDGDGDQDIIKLTTLFDQAPFQRGVYVLWNDGTGDFNNLPFQHIPADQPYMFMLEDFNGDTVLDMYVVNDGADEVYLTTGVVADTSWNFTIGAPTSASRTTGFGGNLRTVDIDNDGDMDIAVGPIDTDIANCGVGAQMAFLRNNGAGGLSDPYNAGPAQNFNDEAHDFEFLDLNGDGCMDIFMAMCTGYRVLIQTGCTAPMCNEADLGEPFGELNFSDVVAFLTAFGAMEPGADLALPFGEWNFSDVVAFLGAFGTGCP